MKRCSKCKIEKDETNFYKDKNKNDGLESSCKTCRSQHRKIYYRNNKEKSKMQHQKWVANNKEHRRKYKTNYNTQRQHRDPLFDLKRIIHHRIKKVIHEQNYTKNSKTYEYLRCSYAEFMQYLGPKPEGDIHLDHICPCAQAQNEEELIKLQHYTNFRWLLAEQNLYKSNNKTPEAEEMCRKLLGREWIDVI